jgi:glycosyltransferase involved in cell wall biosynthesis
VETMGCGYASIATNQEAMRDIITDTVRRIGWCAPRERQTADAICLILGSDDLQKELAENALSYMYEGLDWHIVSEKYTQIATSIVTQDETINEARHDKK